MAMESSSLSHKCLQRAGFRGIVYVRSYGHLTVALEDHIKIFSRLVFAKESRRAGILVIEACLARRLVLGQVRRRRVMQSFSGRGAY